MKGQKPEEPPISISPSQKKLKQARLPFMVLGDTSPVPRKITPKKRNISPKEKDTDKNNLTEDSIVISDDENQSADTETLKINPYVKLVDTVLKKKSQKNKTSKNSKKTRKGSKKRKSDDTSETDTNNVESSTNSETTGTICEPDVSIIVEDTDNDEEPADQSLITTPESNNNDKKSTPVKNKNESTKTTEIDDKKINRKTKLNRNKTNKIDDKLNDENIVDEIKLNTTGVDEVKTNTDEDDKANLNATMEVDEHNSTEVCDKSMNDLNNSVVGLDTDKSNPCTPTRAKSGLRSDSQNNSLNESLSNLTPKQKQRKLESIKRREEREKERLEREKKRQQEKEERDRAKKEKEDQKKKEREEKEEIKRKEREDKEEQRKKEKEEKDKQRELEKKQREEKEELKKKEREEKEEQKRKEKETRESERKKKQEALELEKQEQELKKKKAAEAFVNFFVPKQKSDKDDQPFAGPSSKNNLLSTFAVKSDMRLAPNTRVKLTDDRRSVLDNHLESQKCDMLYLKSLKSLEYKPETCGKTWPLEDKDECMIIEDELPPIDCAGEMISCESAVRERLRPKLLRFHENRRPPYWGTWRKKSHLVTPRTPFGQDQKLLEYEVDSDEEWEEEAEGESISGSAAGSDIEPEDDYELDNKVFVPHGYLSDEEGTMDGDEMLSLSPETQKAKLKLLEDEFESEHKKQTEKLKPRLYGLIWETADCGKPENCVDVLWNYFQKLSMIMDDPTPYFKPTPEPDESEKKKTKKRKLVEGEQQSPQSDKRKKSKVESGENKSKTESKKKSVEAKNQPGINCFLTKVPTKNKAG